jgi:hypothetical protein
LLAAGGGEQLASVAAVSSWRHQRINVEANSLQKLYRHLLQKIKKDIL